MYGYLYHWLLSGPNTYHETYTLAHLPDDMTVGLTIGELLMECLQPIHNYYCRLLGILLGYNLTEVNDMKNQFDSMPSASLKDLKKYVSFVFIVSCSLIVFIDVALCQFFDKICKKFEGLWIFIECTRTRRSKMVILCSMSTVKLFIIYTYAFRVFLLYHCFLYPTVSWCRHISR